MPRDQSFPGDHNLVEMMCVICCIEFHGMQLKFWDALRLSGEHFGELWREWGADSGRLGGEAILRDNHSTQSKTHAALHFYFKFK